MRKYLVILLLITFHVTAFCQSYPGYNSGNYTGVNGVFFNPANVAGSRYRWDFNLIGVNTMVGSNGTTFNLKDIGTKFKGNLDSAIFGNSSKVISAMMNLDILGPSVMFNVNDKTSFALTSRVRGMINAQNIDGNLIQSINQNLNGSFPITISSPDDQKIKINAWGEFGATMGKVLFNKDKNYIKAGISLKYLAGVANTYINIGSFQATANQIPPGSNTKIYNASGNVAIGIGGINVDNFKANDLLKFQTTGFGADLGAVYEYRPDENSNRYKFKAGISLLDIGALNYTPTEAGAYSIHIGPAGWDPSALKDSSISGIKNYLDTHSSNFTASTHSSDKYKVPLPTSVLLDVDYHLHKGFYVGLSGHLSAAQKSNLYGSFYYNSFTLTPRYEGKSFGLYVPINYNSLTNFNAGLSMRFGSLFIGSGSILTALLNNSKQADFHFGLRVGVLKKKHKIATPKAVVVTPVVVDLKDTDGDGILDKDDSCPTVKGVLKYHGCPIPDTDGDGINDEEDSCPTVKGLLKYHGCPVPDTDGDGIDDEHDSCPTVKGLLRYHGCPIPDTDGDGINDEEDSCPTVKGLLRYHGCPIPDTDGDGINDEEDKCPTVPGPKSNFGCPIIQKELIKKINVAAKGLQFQTGKAIILKKSYAQLNNVVKILKADPSLKIDIQGHTDNVGKEEKNLALSIDRANAAKDYFVKNGIPESRITAEGFGSTKPLVPNTTSANRLKNRRVEFTINNY